eukprot:scaffold50473_cov19-Tisochrysis_lutea.AAC.2
MQREQLRTCKALAEEQRPLYHPRWSLGQGALDTLPPFDLPLALHTCLAQAALANSTCSSGAHRKHLCWNSETAQTHPALHGMGHPGTSTSCTYSWATQGLQNCASIGH